MNDLVSVIVPVYNVEKYLKRCVDSLIGQTHKNIEILLIDDGSKDSSLEMCREYEKADSRIKVYHKENQGLGLTRNYALQYISGDYVTFIDSDDYIVPNAIEVMLEKAIATDADVVIANHFYKDEPQKVYFKERLYSGKDIEKLVVRAMGNSPYKLDALSYTAWAKLYKKELFEQKGFRFPSEREYIWEDLVFNTDVFPACERIYITHTPVYYYCFNEGSLTHTYKPNKLELVMKLYNYMVNKVEELELGRKAKIRLDTNFIGHVRTCIKLEVFYAKENGYKTAFDNIKAICCDPDVEKLIGGYPEKYYNKAQRLMNFFMKHKIILGVYGVTWLQNKRKRIE